MANIQLLTFKTGQTILADLSYDDGVYTLKTPVNIVPQQTEKGMMLGFLPFLDYSEEFKTGIQISEELVMTVNTPVRELVNQYNRVFGSGIEIASNIPNV